MNLINFISEHKEFLKEEKDPKSFKLGTEARNFLDFLPVILGLLKKQEFSNIFDIEKLVDIECFKIDQINSALGAIKVDLIEENISIIYINESIVAVKFPLPKKKIMASHPNLTSDIKITRNKELLYKDYVFVSGQNKLYNIFYLYSEGIIILNRR